MKKNVAAAKAQEEFDAVFAAEGITIRDLVATVNETRKNAMRYSTKDGSPAGPDFVTRAKMAIVLLELRGLPAKGANAGAPLTATPEALRDLLSEPAAAERSVCEELGL